MKNKVRVSLLFIVLVCSCTTSPLRIEDKAEVKPDVGDKPRLARIFASVVDEHPDKTGVILLRNGRRALRERIVLAEQAERSIDAQYFIWNSDRSGNLLLQALIQAADRGVSIRLLLDDFNIGDRTPQFLAVNSHPKIQVRAYNPFVNRSGIAKWMNMASDFGRLNRRMHNKTYIIDDTIAIVGGRNIGDEYFNLNEHINHTDLDLLAVGSAVKQISDSFEDYWISPRAIPIDQLVKDAAAEPDTVYPWPIRGKDGREASWMISAVNGQSIEAYSEGLLNEFIWAPAVFIQDLPWSDQNRGQENRPKAVAKKLRQLAEDSKEEILIESAYLVFDEQGTELAARLVKQGVRIRALTNSMASNDVLPNHASYAMVRRKMLNSGISLYELRPDAESCLGLIGFQEYCDQDSFLSLHSKSAVFDRQTLYIGSLNLNLRSVYLNTEVGMIIDSPVLAEQLSRQIEMNMRPVNSWQILIEDDQLRWITTVNGINKTTSIEPRTRWLQRFKAGVLMILPGAQYY
ncbi:MAG: phospholipase D family protein [Desulfocapsaceae bacterium]